MVNSIVEFHNDIFFALHRITDISPEINQVIYLIAEKLDWYVVIGVVLFIVLHRHRRNTNTSHVLSRVVVLEGIHSFISVLLAWALVFVMKLTYMVPRPFLQFSELNPLFIYGGYDSFPSGHATFFSALAFAVLAYHKRTGYLLIFCAFLIGLTRIISGVHFPLDIIVGWLLGWSIAFLVCRFSLVPYIFNTLKKVKNRIK